MRRAATSNSLAHAKVPPRLANAAYRARTDNEYACASLSECPSDTTIVGVSYARKTQMAMKKTLVRPDKWLGPRIGDRTIRNLIESGSVR
jgi:hypothetical protein